MAYRRQIVDVIAILENAGARELVVGSADCPLGRLLLGGIELLG